VSFVAAPVLNFLVELDMVDIDGRVCDGNVFVIPNWFRFGHLYECGSPSGYGVVT
jgi:hypothetical protein